MNEFLEEHDEELIKAFDQELNEWELVGDVEESEIEEAKVTYVEVRELISFGSTEEGGPILVIGRFGVEAVVSYTHPEWDTATYDSEDKILIPHDDVSGETDVSFDVDASMSIVVGENGIPKRIEDLQFRSTDFLFIELHNDDPRF